MKMIILTSAMISFTIFCMQETDTLQASPLITHVNHCKIKQLLEEIKKYNNISMGSSEGYIYPLSIGSINFALLYLCYTFRATLHKVEHSENDTLFNYIAMAGLTTGALLWSMPLLKIANYTCKRQIQKRRVDKLIKENISQYQISQILTCLESPPIETISTLGLKEEEVICLKPFLEDHHKKTISLISLGVL